MKLKRHLPLFLILISVLAASSAFAQSDFSEQDLAIPENSVQGKPGELKTDVPMDSLSIGNQEDTGEAAKAPAATEIPPPQSTTKSKSVKKAVPPPLEEIPPPDTTNTAAQPQPTAAPETPAPRTRVESDSEGPVGDEAEKANAAAADAADSGSTMVDPEAGDPEEDVAHPRNKICNCQFNTSVPYSERRTPLGGYFAVGAGNFSPVNYQPDFNPGTFAQYYDKVSPSVEMTFGLKYNFFLGSLSAQLSGGYFKATSSSDGGVLTLFPVTVGVNFALDNLFKEPYVVPYVVVGEYSDLYNESVGGQTVKGNSAFSEFYGFGLLFQLDALDEEAHNSAYKDFGLENTFLYFEARSYLPAQNDLPDFSTPLQFSGGLKVEF